MKLEMQDRSEGRYDERSVYGGKAFIVYKSTFTHDKLCDLGNVT